jgi:6-pyruvoyltetrahydropterin/6-carboxytetrahydropterin synthase
MMLELSRTVRFCVNDPPSGVSDGGDGGPRDNTFAAWPAMRGLGRYYELDVTCRGEADPVTGYFINIKKIDRAVQEHALPCFDRALCNPAGVPMGGLMQSLLSAIGPALHDTVTCVELRLTPTYRIAIRSQDMDHVLIRQQYEFSAAHRLHVPDLSDQENVTIFGKCNNPAGHGHNYRLQVVVRVPIDPAGRAVDAAELDAIVNRHAIALLDHKHLNIDVPQFAELNPSVEHIVREIWAMLEGPLTGLAKGSTLEELSVWETSKTVCTYRGPVGANAAAEV